MNTDIKFFKQLLKDTWKAFRPLSLTLAIGSTTLGIIAANRIGSLFNDGLWFDMLTIVLITIAGLLVQSGANLINDYFEGDFRYYRNSISKVRFLGVERSYFDIYIFLIGMATFLFTCLIGLYLIIITDIKMFIIGIVGVIGSYAYTGEPFVYKRHGLGAILSFILMGPLMVLGAFYPFTQELSMYPILLALPASMIIPALMLSNELRDFKRDTNLSLGTLSVRIGHKVTLVIYSSLTLGAYLVTVALIIAKVYPIQALLVFLTFPIAIKAFKAVKEFKGVGIPYTNKLHYTFTGILILVLAVF